MTHIQEYQKSNICVDFIPTALKVKNACSEHVHQKFNKNSKIYDQYQRTDACKLF